jgi:hypothetical protein
VNWYPWNTVKLSINYDTTASTAELSRVMPNESPVLAVRHQLLTGNIMTNRVETPAAGPRRRFFIGGAGTVAQAGE